MITATTNNMPESYLEFFQRITQKGILPYQERYGRNPFSPTLLVIPTGLGKTDCVLVPWLYAHANGHAAPTRLILVLPRQNLTAQTAKNARTRVCAAGLEQDISVLELMAGSRDNDEKLRPDRPTVIVSTQDLYFSRALNRGYARWPLRWPIDFALYNQDCLIVLDEVQLMDDALATSTQLAAFREQFGVFGAAASVWMSATVNPAWLQTVDFEKMPVEIRLSDEDMEEGVVQQRIHAAKHLARAPESCRTPAGCASFGVERHRPETRTLIIANTVRRAREIFEHVEEKFPGAVLLHSRFRPADRAKAAAMLEIIPPEGQIVVATQVLEAGVDITARLLITDVAPWGSLVQRFGRVNRYGGDADAEIWWVDEPTYAKQKNPTAPYLPEEIARAVARLENRTSGSPIDLPHEDGPEPWQHVLRRADLLDLFDTSPDLSGNELDISRFIRATEDKDIYLAWREWQGAGPPPWRQEVADDELCPAPIGDLREFSKKHAVYAWNFAVEEWAAIDHGRMYPGMLVVTRCAEGGYTAAGGWSPDSKAKVEPLRESDVEVEGDSSDPRSFLKYRQTLVDHSDRVLEEVERLLARVSMPAEYADGLRRAAALHDWGKVHPVFHETMHRNDSSPEFLAKQIGNARHSRPHFRHELATALAMLATGEPELVAYLAAAHHGRIRMGIRSMPGEREEDGIRVARGIREGDALPECELATGGRVPAIALSLALMEFGTDGGSWTDRMLQLLDEVGPFRLAYLEMLLRTADEAASAEPKLETVCTP